MLWLSPDKHQALQLPSDRRMKAILRDGPSKEGLPLLPGEEGGPSADRLARTLAGLAIQADRKASNRGLLGRFAEAIGLVRGANEKFLRNTGEVVLRALVDGVPTALLERRDTVFGVAAQVGGVDEAGRVGARFRRSHEVFGDGIVNVLGAIGDEVVGVETPPIDRSYRVNGAFDEHSNPYQQLPPDAGTIARRLDAMTDLLQTSDSVSVEALSPHPRSIGLSTNELGKDSIQYHLMTAAPASSIR